MRLDRVMDTWCRPSGGGAFANVGGGAGLGTCCMHHLPPLGWRHVCENLMGASQHGMLPLQPALPRHDVQGAAWQPHVNDSVGGCGAPVLRVRRRSETHHSVAETRNSNDVLAKMVVVVHVRENLAAGRQVYHMPRLLQLPVWRQMRCSSASDRKHIIWELVQWPILLAIICNCVIKVASVQSVDSNALRQSGAGPRKIFYHVWS